MNLYSLRALSVCVVFIISVSCLALVFWMSQTPNMVTSVEGKAMFEALNIAWRLGFGSIAGLLIIRPKPNK